METLEIYKVMENAWKEFTDHYSKLSFNYSKNEEKIKNYKEAKESHWLCWNESDLMVQFAIFFYKELEKNNISDIEMHFDKNLNKTNFKGYTFEKELNKLISDLKRKLKVDLIITKEDSTNPFEICAEAKSFHYSTKIYSKEVIDVIKKDLDTLLSIKKYGIANQVVFILFDDYYYLNDPERCQDIDDLLNLEKYRKDIQVLQFATEAKVRYWKNKMQAK